jgi:hypothetical protein
MREDLGTAVVADVEPATTSVLIAFAPGQGTGSIHGIVQGFSDRAWTYGVVLMNDGAAQAVIGRDGAFRLENAPAGEVELRAQAMNARERATTPPVRVTVTADADVEATLAFRNDITVRGTVSEGGTPAAGRNVEFSNDRQQWSTRTGEDGTYEISGLEPGMYNVTVGGRRREFRARYPLSASATYDIAIAFVQLSGRVVDGSGAPIAAATIDARGETNQSAESTTTDATGSFRLAMNDARSFVVSASKKGFAASVQRVENATMPLEFTLVRSDGIRIRLVDARNGATLKGYAVATDASGLPAARAEKAESDGTLRLDLGDGGYRISVSAAGFATQSKDVVVPARGELRFALTPGGTLVVKSDRPSYDLVKLVMPNGVEYVRCECDGIAEIRLTGTTTTIEHVAPGRYTMQVLDANGSLETSYPVTITEGQTSVAEISVPP